MRLGGKIGWNRILNGVGIKQRNVRSRNIRQIEAVADRDFLISDLRRVRFIVVKIRRYCFFPFFL